MTQEEFEDKLAKLVYRFVNNNEDEDLEECERQWWIADAAWRQAASSDCWKDVSELPSALYG